MEEKQVVAIAYIRVSYARQVTDGNSLVVQRILVTRYAELRGYRLIHIFVEEAETAKTDDREALQEMLSKLESGEIKADVLIIPKIDRLARNRDDYGAIKKAVRLSGLKVESCSETIEDTPAGRFTESVIASAAQFDNEVRAERARDGMVQAATEGRWVWRAPLGYKSVRVKTGKKGGLGNIAPDEPMATVIRELFDRIASRRQPVRQAMYWLETVGVRIAPGNLYHLLRNPVYCGTIVAFGSEFEASPPFVPLITREQFALVQSITKRAPPRPAVYDHDNPDYPLRGCLKCESCGGFLTAAWTTGRGKRFPYYRCMGCPNMNLKRDMFEDRFASELARFKTDRMTMAKLRSAAITAYERQSAQSTQQKDILETELARVVELRQQVGLKTASGIIPDDLGKEQLLSLTAEIGRLQSELKEHRIVPAELVEALDFAESFFKTLPMTWRRGDIKPQKKLQSFFFPDGLIAEKSGNLRIIDYPLLEQVKATFCDRNYSLVDPNLEIPNEVARFLIRLKDEFEVDPSTLLDSDGLSKRDRGSAMG